MALPEPTIQQIVLAVNGTPTASQNRADFTAGAGILISPIVGGGIAFSSTSGIPTGLLPFGPIIPTGDIPGRVFTVPGNLVLNATVFLNGLAQTPGTSYTQSGNTFTLATSLTENDSIVIQGFQASS